MLDLMRDYGDEEHAERFLMAGTGSVIDRLPHRTMAIQNVLWTRRRQSDQQGEPAAG